MYAIFSGFTEPLEQVACAQLLTSAAKSLTCEQIATAASGSHNTIRQQVVEELAVKCCDKQNSHLVQAKLTPFQYMLVKKQFES